MMAIKPWGGNHANLLHSLRSQRTNQLTGGDHPGLCETVLPMSGCPLRPHMGFRTHVQALLARADSAPGNTFVRTHQEFASGTAARAISPSGRLATRLITSQDEPSPRFPQSPPTQRHQVDLFSINGGSHIGMPAAQAYKPPTHCPLTPAIAARRYPPSGRSPVKTTPQNIICAARTCPRSLPVNFATHLGAPNYCFVPARSPALSAGYLAWVQGTVLPLGGRAARAPHKKLSVAN